MQIAPRPEVYQVYSTSYDPSIIEQGPFIHTNGKAVSPGMMKPTMFRPPGHVQTYFRRNYDIVLNNSNGHGMRVNPGSGGSTPASSSSSSGPENCQDQKESSR